MKKYWCLNSKMLFVMMTLIFSMGFMSCSSDDEEEDNVGLNSYEKALVGLWVSIDDDVEVFYLDLKADRTGKWTSIYDGEQDDSETYIHWEATKDKITLINKDGESMSGSYSIDGDKAVIGEVLYQKK